MHRYKITILSIYLIFQSLAVNALAQPVSGVVNQADIEKHVLILTQELRCLVCQNQTIADSQADLAVDLRNQVRELLLKGKSDQQILDFMVQRYGDFILYRPPIKSTTWVLWFGPLMLLVGGLLFLVFKLRNQKNLLASNEIRAVDLRNAEHLLLSDSKNGESI